MHREKETGQMAERRACPKCGRATSTERRNCIECGTPLDSPLAVEPLTVEIDPESPRLIQCPDCDGRVSALAAACPHCGRPMKQQQPTSTVLLVRSAKSAGLAAVLSFLWCGLGQIYNGEVGKGIIIGLLYLFSI